MTQWQGRTRGGLFGYKFFVFIISKLGLSFAYFFLKFVALYFLLSASKARKSIFKFYRTTFKYSKLRSHIYVYKNYCKFGEVLVDKIALLSGTNKKFTFDFDGEGYLNQLAEKKTGGILVTSHVGNWEIAGQLLERINTKVNILVFDGEHEKIKNYLNGVMEKRIGFIYINQDLSHVELMKRAFENNEIIAINADRYIQGNKIVKVDFFGKKAGFPIGPFYMAGRYDVPVIFSFGMKETKYHYHFYASPPKKVLNFNNLKKRDESINNIVKEYAEHLENIVKKYPLQWFNYYNFWKE